MCTLRYKGKHQVHLTLPCLYTQGTLLPFDLTSAPDLPQTVAVHLNRHFRQLKSSHPTTMLFSKLAIGSLLALVSSVASASLTTYSYNTKLIHHLQQVVASTVTYTANE
jgi:hypothetical protein